MNTHNHKEGRFADGRVNIWHWNINGLNAVLTKGSLQEFFDNANPDILCLNEIKIDEEKIIKNEINRYMP
jgi:exonuclease III